MSYYEEMIQMVGELRNIERTLSLLAWDERTYMPEGALQGRAEMKGMLSKKHHNIFTSDKMKKCIRELNKTKILDELDDIQRASVREITRDFERKHNIPDELVEKLVKASSQGQAIWTKARQKSDFDMFADALKLNVELNKEVAEYIGYEVEPYDALLDGYEPGLTAVYINDVFEPMKKKLSKIVDKIASKEQKGNHAFKDKKFDIDTQKKLCHRIAEDIGFDFNRGRIDDSVHPFTVGMDYETRITNRYDENDLSSIFSLLHEAGHGMYELGVSPDLYCTPLGKALSMGYHESQSRLWENFVGRSRAFMDHLYPLILDYFPDMGSVSIDELYRTINKVEPSFIRVEADELTYNLHIALRFDIELALFRDELEPHETETVWQDKMEEYLGLRPEDPAQGVLQDIHWSSAAFGYFPSYSLGNLYAAQIYNRINTDIPSLNEDISKGNFSELGRWLKENIHRHGKTYQPKEITETLTGGPLDFKYFHDYVKEKYGGIYEL